MKTLLVSLLGCGLLVANAARADAGEDFRALV